MHNGDCLVCGKRDCATTPIGGNLKINCRRCGEYILTDEGRQVATHHYFKKDAAGLPASHAIRCMTTGQVPIITGQLITDLLENTVYPSIQQQIDNIVLYLGKCLNGVPGHHVEPKLDALCGIVGTSDRPDKDNYPALQFVVDYLAQEEKFIKELSSFFDSYKLQLTMLGWKRYEELLAAHTKSKKIFMAMQFNNESLQKIVSQHFIPAVSKAGFTLFRVNDMNIAGSIDDKIRVDIRSSRMLIADLTDQNRGAYWESGFAEGLGKPVIYTCESSVFETPGHIHFDTRQLYHVLWNLNDPQHAARELTIAIRNTLPDEAIMEDE